MLIVWGLLLILPFLGILTDPGYFIPAWAFGLLIGWVIAKVVAGKKSKPSKMIMIVVAYAVVVFAGGFFWKLTGARLS